MFALWMHHEYPRECPFPHLAGTTKPQTFAAMGMAASAIETEEHMKSFASREARKNAPVRTAPWQKGEELPAALSHEHPAGALEVQLLALLVVFALASRSLWRAGSRAGAWASRDRTAKSASSGPQFLV
eukprot:SRR837773.11743.p2 GENE.SRR837773.11743~~SRR837773.11743.p2  ORF type:complete len:129 (-),score=16.03 SRR837773.11743:26-412(-)